MNDKNIIKEIEIIQKNILTYLVNNKKYLYLFNPPSEEFNEEDINFMLLNNGKNNLVFQSHKLIIANIIYNSFFKEQKISKERLSKYFFCFQESSVDQIPFDFSLNNNLRKMTRENICDILEKCHIHYLNSKFVYKKIGIINEKSNINFKDNGSVYTPLEITKEITYKTIKNKLDQNISVEHIKILDFGCATGRFFLKAFEYLTNIMKLDKRKVIKDNLYGVDIDELATDILKIKLYCCLDDARIEDLEIITKNITNENMLIEEKYFDSSGFNKNFNKVISKGGFDVIISNPPYFLLKVNRKLGSDKNMSEYYNFLKKRINEEVKYFRKSGKYNLSIEGMLNYYKLSIEAILKICKKNGEIGIICPSTLFADLSSKKLRKYIILNNKLREIKYFPESTKIFDNITQSTVIFYLKKEGKTNNVNITVNSESFKITTGLIEKVFGQNYEIPYIDKIGWSILNKISNFNKIKEIKYIRNKRGELDLTLFKKYITKENTGWRLVRGKMISKDTIVEKNGEYILINDFLKRKSKEYLKNDFKKERLICQQISNNGIKKRLQFVKCKKNDIIANSCNYLTVLEGNLDQIKDILNSYLLNWRFKITSSNNHINNYEIAELPLIDIKKTHLLKKDDLGKNIEICKRYSLNKNEIIYILKPFFNIEEIEKELRKNENLQPYCTKV